MIRINAAVLALAAAVGLAACQQDDMGPPNGSVPATQPAEAQIDEPALTTPAQAERRPIVTVSDIEPWHLVDGAGQALYVLDGNRDGSRCDAACEHAWPPVLAEQAEPMATPGGLQAELGTMSRDDGGLHVTWQGQPLYRYAADAGVGATAGHDVDDQWGVWSLVSPEGSPIPR